MKMNISIPKRQQYGELVWYAPPRIRRVRMPLSELEAHVPDEAWKYPDNSGVRFEWGLYIGAVGVLLGTVIAALMALEQGNSVNVAMLPVPPALAGLIGWYFGSNVVAPMFYRPAAAWVTVRDGNIAPLMPDLEMPHKWAEYFGNLKAKLEEHVGAEKAESLIDPQRAGVVTARYDARTMAYIERMENEAMDAKGGLSWQAKAAIVGVGGVVAIVFGGLVLFTAVMGDQKARNSYLEDFYGDTPEHIYTI